MSTLWHFIAYIDVSAEQQLAVNKAEERARMIEKTKADKNKQVEDADIPESDDEDVSFYNKKLNFSY